jgi:hypothetical protein
LTLAHARPELARVWPAPLYSQLPTGDEVAGASKKQNTTRQNKERKKRLNRLRYWNDVYCKKVYGISTKSTSPDCSDSTESFVLVTHGFGALQPSPIAKGHESNPSPNGVDARDLDRAMQQDPWILAELPVDEVEHLLDEKHTTIFNGLAEGFDQATLSGQSASSGGSSLMDVEHALEEFMSMSTVANTLSLSDFRSVTAAVSTLSDARCGARCQFSFSSPDCSHSCIPLARSFTSICPTTRWFQGRALS